MTSRHPPSSSSEELDLDHPTTVTAWSQREKPARNRGAFGGKLGGFRLRKSKQATLNRNSNNEDTNYLLGENSSSPEAGSLLSMKSSFTAESSSTSLSTSVTKNEENVVHPNRLLFQRSNSIAVLPPKPIRQHRRFSLATTTVTNRDSSTGSSSADDYGFWTETGFEQRLADIEGEGTRERKKIRARRASIQGSVTPLNHCTSLSHVQSSAEDWRRHEGSPSSSRMSDVVDFQDNSSPARSVASSRKRGVGGSPLFSDMDDFSVGGMSVSNNSNRTRSRSRIFSPGAPFPFQIGNQPQRSSPDEVRGGVMDIDSDDEDEDDDHSSQNSPDTSLDSSMHEDAEIGRLNYASATVVVTNEKDVIETMPSFEDLKFVLKALRKENRKRRTGAFGVTESWTVAPNPKWSASRRSAFFQWMTRNLGFSMRALGGAMNFLQISKSKGQEILPKLEAGLVLHVQKQATENGVDAKLASTFEDSFSFMDTSGLSAIKSVDKSFQPRTSFDPTARLFGSCENDPNYSAEDGLLQSMMGLSMKDQQIRPSDISLVRHVTLDTANDIAPARPSMDNHFPTDAIMCSLHGDSPRRGPRDRSLKPPRTSYGNNRMSTGTVQSNRNSTGIPFAISAAPSFDIVETPLNAVDENWGSCPVPGRDWGGSTRCDEAILAHFHRLFESSSSAAGVRDSFGETGLQPFSLAADLRFDDEGGGFEVEARCSPDKESETRIAFLDPIPAPTSNGKDMRRRKQSLAKHRRMSLFISAAGGDDKAVQRGGLFQGGQSPILLKRKILDRISSDEFPLDDFAKVSINDKDGDVFTRALNENTVAHIFSFLTERALLQSAMPVCSAWAEAASTAHANLMLNSVGQMEDDAEESDSDRADECCQRRSAAALSMERSWYQVNTLLPQGKFLGDGGMKDVYKVYNSCVGDFEAVSVMDVEAITNKRTIASELAVSSLLSSLVRRGICPNFVLTHGMFTCGSGPAESHWGSREIRSPKPPQSLPEEPDEFVPGRYHYIRMELCDKGDAEEYIKDLPDELLPPQVAQSLVFQIAFALHAAADRYSIKHYDVKMLNVFIQSKQDLPGDLVLRYGLGSHMFALRMPQEQALVAKLADYGTANTKAESNGQPVTIAQFTTLENTPVDYLILGDKATQGHGHDCFGLGLCMLHAFTGCAPYEEILGVEGKEVVCPPVLRKKLKAIWEQEGRGYDIIRSVILADVDMDEAGHIIEGDPDETLYDTLYRFLVLFGIPEEKFGQKECPQVWNAITDALIGEKRKNSKVKKHPDATQYKRDCRMYSIESGSNKYIARARKQLKSMEGGMELLKSLCCFDPVKRSSALDVLNSTFMSNLREPEDSVYNRSETVHSYTAFSTHHR